MRCLSLLTKKEFCNSIITSAPVLVHFDNSKETVVSVDASNTGLGAVIMQEGKPDAFSSKTLTGLQNMCAKIYRRLLAIAWGAQEFHTMCTGSEVLLGQFTNQWSQSLLETTEWGPSQTTKDAVETHQVWPSGTLCPGKQKIISDCLSRAPLSEP